MWLASHAVLCRCLCLSHAVRLSVSRVERYFLCPMLSDALDLKGKLLMINICNFHVLSHLLLIYMCKLHWKCVCPMLSDALDLKESPDGKNLCLTCEDGKSSHFHRSYDLHGPPTPSHEHTAGSSFSFPLSDCVRLPLMHSSAEEMAHYLWLRLLGVLGLESLQARGIVALEVSLSEAPGQAAVYRRSLPATAEELQRLASVPIVRRPAGCKSG